MPGPEDKKSDQKSNQSRRDFTKFTHSERISAIEEISHTRKIAISKKIPLNETDANKDKYAKEWVTKHVKFYAGRNYDLDTGAVLGGILDVRESVWLRWFLPDHPKTALVVNPGVILKANDNLKVVPLAVRSEKVPGAKHLGEIQNNLSKCNIRNFSGILTSAVVDAEGDLKRDNLLVGSNGAIIAHDNDRKRHYLQWERFGENNREALEKTIQEDLYSYNFSVQELQALPNLPADRLKKTKPGEPQVSKGFCPMWWPADMQGSHGTFISRRLNVAEVLNFTPKQKQEFQKQKLHDFLKRVATPDAFLAEIFSNAVSYEEISHIQGEYGDGTLNENNDENVKIRSVVTKEKYDEFYQRCYDDACQRRQLFIQEVFKLDEFSNFYFEELKKIKKGQHSAFHDFADDFVKFQKNSKSDGASRYWPGKTRDQAFRELVIEAKKQFKAVDYYRKNDDLSARENKRYHKLHAKKREQLLALQENRKTNIPDNYKVLYMFAHLQYQGVRDGNKDVGNNVAGVTTLADKLKSKLLHVIDDSFTQLARADIKTSVRRKLLIEFDSILQQHLFPTDDAVLDEAAHAGKLRLEFRDAWLNAGIQVTSHPLLKHLQTELPNLSNPDDQAHLLYAAYQAALEQDKDSKLTLYLQNALGSCVHGGEYALQETFAGRDAIIKQWYAKAAKQKPNHHILTYNLYQFLKQTNGWGYRIMNAFPKLFAKSLQKIKDRINLAWTVIDTLAANSNLNLREVKIQVEVEISSVQSKSTSDATRIAKSLQEAAKNKPVESLSIAKADVSLNSDKHTSSDEEKATSNTSVDEFIPAGPVGENLESKTIKSISVISAGLDLFSRANPNAYPLFIQHLRDFLDTTDDHQMKEYFLWVCYEATCEKGGSEGRALAKFLRRALMLQITHDAVAVIKSKASERDATIKNHFAGRFKDVVGQDMRTSLQNTEKQNQIYNYYLSAKEATVDRVVGLFDLELKTKHFETPAFTENWGHVQTYVENRNQPAVLVEDLIPENALIRNPVLNTTAPKIN